MATFDENGNYVKTTWKGGDKITAAKLNKIEESLEAINNNDVSRHVETDARLDALESGTTSDKQQINAKVDALEDVVEANKDAADLEIYSINQHMTLLDKKMDDGVAEVEAIANTVDGKITAAETNIQNQVNQGKADMEAMVAEVEADLEGLHAKDDELSEQLEHIAKTKVEKDIDSTTIKANTKIDIENLRMKQVQLFNKFTRGLRTGENKVICCQGDSLTYGADNNSDDKRPADSTPAPDGSYNVSSRASVTYPEAMVEYLNNALGKEQVSFINRGYSGIYAEHSYEMWYTKHNADLTIFMLGTNDSRNTNCPYAGEVDTYLYWMEQLIIRELLWDKAVVLLTPPKTKRANDLNILTFGKALKLLADKYCIPLLDTVEVFKNYSNSIYNDDTHFTGEGYKVLGSRVATFLLSNGEKKSVNTGNVLLTRELVDGVVYSGNATQANISAVFTPDEYMEGYGIYAKIESEGKATYNFYCENDNVAVIPIVSIYSGQTFKMTLDNETVTPKISMVQTILGDSSSIKQYSNKYELTNINESNIQTEKKNYILNREIPLFIVQKGWHSISIECGNCNFFGLEFVGINEFFPIKNTGYYIGTTHASYDDHLTDVTETRLPLEELKKHLGDIFYNNMLYFKSPMLEITVTNYYKNVIKYWVMCGRTSNSNEWLFLGEQSKAGRTNENERTITNVTLDTATNELVISWGGATTYESCFVISIY